MIERIIPVFLKPALIITVNQTEEAICAEAGLHTTLCSG